MTGPSSNVDVPRRIGRYALHGAIGSGGMATVHLGRLFGPQGFKRIVAIKRLHTVYAEDPAFTARFMQEARLASRIRHPNVVPVLDVHAEGGELSLVMEYVEGESLARLLRIARERCETVPPHVAVAIVANVLHGLHAAHTSESEDGQPLGVVHRDVSPQNIMVGANGVAQLLDFGVAKAASLSSATRGAIGKIAYMAPEQIRREPVSARTDVYAASVVLWEAICSLRLFRGEDEAEIVEQILIGLVPPPSKFVPTIEEALERLIARGLASDASSRPAARELALALEPFAALPSAVASWIRGLAGERLDARATLVREVERAEEPEHVAYITSPPRSRRTRLLIVLGLGGLLLLVAIGLGLWSRKLAPKGIAPAPAVETSTVAKASSVEPPTSAVTLADTHLAPLASVAPTAVRTKPSAVRPAKHDAPPTAPARRCESVDLATGDIRFDPGCRP